MRKVAVIALLLFLLIACKEELPPSPPPPGGEVSVGRALAGLAGALPSWASPAHDVAITPQQAYYGDGVVVAVSGIEYIYQNAYVFNSKVRSWEKFTLQGELNKEWIKEQAIGSVAVSSDKFAEGDNYLVVYACSKAGGKWDCSGNKWMLVTFKVLGSPTGQIPELANVNNFVINGGIPPFAVLSTTAEKDNFAEINVIRYDAKYSEPINGLVVLVHVFDFNNRAEVDKTISTLWRDIIVNGWKVHKGHNIALFLDESDHRDAIWTSGKEIIFVETFQSDSASKEIIEAYLEKYPSDLKKLT